MTAFTDTIASAGIFQRCALFVVALLGALGLAGCATLSPGGSAATQEKREVEIAALIEESSENIVSARASHVRSGLGVNLYVNFDMATDAVTAAELEAVLRVVAPRVPEAIGVVRFSADNAQGDAIPLTDAAEELGLPELSIKSEGVVTFGPKSLAERYEE
ncbi:hypothetical protein FVA74_03725 [Salinibacterium sp. dk2585]|uniref:hypothetical protein n=1 Tax=unclassified Salinibacterium TaxID=2632331 RepID=UPI0011C24895|nr:MULTISPECIES: hypothetical protein [unclassified Salinibacterium]QEE60781.1 hypothetical protein FVA74_03725 [Salinibacterium sp. dk2585]TXK55853.1 hypothetical protein FVP63_03870 [Salinibacterium sp. dk5596]